MSTAESGFSSFADHQPPHTQWSTVKHQDKAIKRLFNAGCIPKGIAFDKLQDFGAYIENELTTLKWCCLQGLQMETFSLWVAINVLSKRPDVVIREGVVPDFSTANHTSTSTVKSVSTGTESINSYIYNMMGSASTQRVNNLLNLPTGSKRPSESIHHQFDSNPYLKRLMMGRGTEGRKYDFRSEHCPPSSGPVTSAAPAIPSIARQGEVTSNQVNGNPTGRSSSFASPVSSAQAIPSNLTDGRIEGVICGLGACPATPSMQPVASFIMGKLSDGSTIMGVVIGVAIPSENTASGSG